MTHQNLEVVLSLIVGLLLNVVSSWIIVSTRKRIIFFVITIFFIGLYLATISPANKENFANLNSHNDNGTILQKSQQTKKQESTYLGDNLKLDTIDQTNLDVTNSGPLSVPSVSREEQRGNEHLIKIQSILGDAKDQSVTVKFLVTNERRDNYEQLWITNSIGKFEGQTYYPTRAMLGDKGGGGRDGVGWTYPQMQTIKGEPTTASMVFTDVPSTVSRFSTMTLNANGDVIAFKNVAIQWQN